MTILQAAQLAERINKNMDDFKASLLALDKESIIAKARQIATVQDAYYHMTTQYDFDDSEAEYLLLFQKPLENVAEIWVYLMDDMDCGFDTALDEFFMRDADDYPLMSDLEDDDGSYGQDYGPVYDFDDGTDWDDLHLPLIMLADCVKIMVGLLSICGYDLPEDE